MKKRILACFMAVCMVVSLSATAIAADETYTDVGAEYGWAKEAIYRWTEAGIVEGNGDGTFNPAGLLKRSEAAKIFANLLKLVEKSDKVFVDVPGTEWYAEYVAKVNKAEIMVGMSDTTFEPDTSVSREMVFTMLCRALGIKAQETLTGTFEDAEKVSDWAKGSVNALVNLGYVDGIVVDGKANLEAGRAITRAEMMVLLNKVIAAYVTESCVVTLDEDAEGVVLVVAEGAEVDMSGVEGTTKVVATVGNVAVKNAPVGTTVSSANGAAGVTANGNEVAPDDSETIVEEDPVVPTPDPVDPDEGEDEKEDIKEEDIVVHAHVYKNWTANEDGTHTGTCECGADTTEDCDSEELEAVEPDCTTGGLTAGLSECSVCGNKEAQKEIPATGHDFPSCGHDEEDALKFELSVEAGAEVAATVYDDYSAVVVIPNEKVDANEVTVTATMKDVASLGVDGEKSHSITVETGIDKEGISLYDHLKNAFNFTEAVVNVDVEGETFVYSVAGSNGTITATPDNVEAARDAWAVLADNVATKDQDEDDSYIVIAKDSYIAVGGEVLLFEDDAVDLTLNGFTSIDDLKGDIKDAVKVVDDEEGLAGAKDMVIYVGEGTELAVGSSVATLETGCEIYIKGINNGQLNYALSDIRDNSNLDATSMVKELVILVNNVIGGLNGKTITVTVDFQ